MIVIAGTVRIRAGMREAAIERGLWMSRLTEGEPGCRHYRFYADLDDPERFLIFEEWEDEVALHAHFGTPHMAEFSGALAELIAAPPTVTRYDVAAARPL